MTPLTGVDHDLEGDMLTFYLGTHQPQWLATAAVPLFVSHRRLAGRRTLPRAAAQWALDSGGFSELSLFGQWRTRPQSYIAAVRRYDQEIGHLAWAAPQDWMCEPVMLGRTGLTVAEHQTRTVANFVLLQRLWGEAATSPFMPVLQGWTCQDYLRCMDLYATAGVDLTSFPLVGLGSVCRRQASGEIAAVVSAIRARDPQIPLHGFGIKLRGLTRYGHHLASADSMAWSFAARRAAPMPGCTHSNCANCLRYALAWREHALHAATRQTEQFDLFEVAV